MDIELATPAATLQGPIDDSEAGRDFVSLLPLTLTLTDFHETEKIADLPRAIATHDAPDGITPSTGDITFYAPRGNLALFYRDFTYSEGLVALGRLDPGAVELLASLDDETMVTITAAT